MTFGLPDRPGTRAGRRRHPIGRRDRRGRGLRGQLMPATVPAARSRAQIFDDVVLDAIEELEGRWSSQLQGVEFAVEEVPPDLPHYDSDVLEDGTVPLARLIPAKRERNASPARIVVYRWPLEARAHGKQELAELVHEVIVEQVANLLGISPDELGE